MNKILVGIMAVVLVCSSTNLFAAFGGSRSSGSFSSGSRSSSSFGGSRSYSAPSARSFGGSRSSQSGPATITRPQRVTPGYSYSTPIQRETTIIHHDSGGGFWNGLFMGSLLNHQQAPVIVTPGVGGMVEGGSVMAPAPVYVNQGHSFFYYFFWTFVLIVCCGTLAAFFLRKE